MMDRFTGITTHSLLTTQLLICSCCYNIYVIGPDDLFSCPVSFVEELQIKFKTMQSSMNLPSWSPLIKSHTIDMPWTLPWGIPAIMSWGRNDWYTIITTIFLVWVLTPILECSLSIRQFCQNSLMARTVKCCLNGQGNYLISGIHPFGPVNNVVWSWVVLTKPTLGLCDHVNRVSATWSHSQLYLSSLYLCSRGAWLGGY